MRGSTVNPTEHFRGGGSGEHKTKLHTLLLCVSLILTSALWLCSALSIMITQSGYY